MTVASSVSKKTMNGNGVTTSWPFDFRVIDESHLKVIVTAPDGVETELSSGYSVALNDHGGAVIYPESGSPLAAGYRITVRRQVPLTQETDIANQGGFYAEVHEDRFDLLAMADQQQQEVLDRAIRLPEAVAGDAALPAAPIRALRAMGFDQDGNPTVSDATLAQLEGAANAVLSGGSVLADPPLGYGDGVTTRFDTTLPLANRAMVQVCVGGVAQASTAYAVDGTAIVFAAPPPDGVPVHARVLGGLDLLSGDASAQTVKPSGATSDRALKDQFRDIGLTVFNVSGVVADGAHDDAPALSAFFAGLGSGGGVIRVPATAKLYLSSSVTVPKGWALVGDGGYGFLDDSETTSHYSFGSSIKLGAGATLTLGERARIDRVLVIRGGLPQPVPDAATALALVAAFSGTAVKFVGKGCHVTRCMLLGHALAIDTNGYGHAYIADNAIHATNGVRSFGGWDSSTIERNTCWPYMTAGVAGVAPWDAGSEAALRSSGIGFDIDGDNTSGPNDWTTLRDNFTYGFYKGFRVNNASNILLSRCQADYTMVSANNFGGFHITGTSNYIRLIECTGITQSTCVTVDTAGASNGDDGVWVTDGLWAAGAAGVNVIRGSVTITGNRFYSGTKGVVLGANAHHNVITGNYFKRVGTMFDVDTAAIATSTVKDNRGEGVANNIGDRTPESLTLSGFVRSSTMFEMFKTDAPANQKYTRLNPSTNGLTLDAVNDAYSAAQTGYLVSRSGNNLSDHKWYNNGAHKLTVTNEVRPNAHVILEGDGAFNIGAAGNRVNNLYLVNAPIVTSDARHKEVRGKAPGLDFILGLEGVAYRLTDAGQTTREVDDSVPGEDGVRVERTRTEFDPLEGSRTHFGVIAQQVKGALSATPYPDAAAWCLADPADPDSRQAVRYEELIASLIEAVKELAARVEALEAK